MREEEGWPELLRSEADPFIKAIIQSTVENRRRNAARRDSKMNALLKKKGRPVKPDSQKKKLKALREEYRKAYLERMNGDKDDDF